MADSRQEHAHRVGMAGFGCLGGLLLGGFGGGSLLVFLGIRAFMFARDEEVRSTAEARIFLSSLEGSVILCAAGALAFLVGIVAGVVLLKEASDDARRRSRGPVVED